jgi:hypothetical protein
LQQGLVQAVPQDFFSVVAVEAEPLLQVEPSAFLQQDFFSVEAVAVPVLALQQDLPSADLEHVLAVWPEQPLCSIGLIAVGSLVLAEVPCLSAAVPPSTVVFCSLVVALV